MILVAVSIPRTTCAVTFAVGLAAGTCVSDVSRKRRISNDHHPTNLFETGEVMELWMVKVASMTISHAKFVEEFFAAQALDEQWGMRKYIYAIENNWAIDDNGVHWIGGNAPKQPEWGTQ